MASSGHSGDRLARLDVRGPDSQSSAGTPLRSREDLASAVGSSQGPAARDDEEDLTLALDQEGEDRSNTRSSEEDMRDDSPPRRGPISPRREEEATPPQRVQDNPDRAQLRRHREVVAPRAEANPDRDQQRQSREANPQRDPPSPRARDRRTSRRDGTRSDRNKRSRKHRRRRSPSISSSSSGSTDERRSRSRGRSRRRSRSRSSSRHSKRRRHHSRGRRSSSQERRRSRRSRTPPPRRQPRSPDRAETRPAEHESRLHEEGPVSPRRSSIGQTAQLTPELQKQQEAQRRQQAAVDLQHPRLYQLPNPGPEHHVQPNVDPNEAYVLENSYLTRGVRRVGGLKAIFDTAFDPHLVLVQGTHCFAARQYVANDRSGAEFVSLPPAASNYAGLTTAHQGLVAVITALDREDLEIPDFLYRLRLAECAGLSRLIATFHELVARGREQGGTKPANFYVAATYYVMCLYNYMATGNLDWLGKRNEPLLTALANDNHVALHCTTCVHLGHLAGQVICPKTPKPSAQGGGGHSRGGGGQRGGGSSSTSHPRQPHRPAHVGQAPDFHPNARGAPAQGSSDRQVPPPQEPDADSAPKGKGKKPSSRSSKG